MRTILLVFFITCSLIGSTQQYSLQTCIDSALRKNIPLRSAKLASDNAKVNVDISKAALVPAVYGDIGQGVNFGRNIDPFTNDYVNRTIGFGSYGVSTNYTIFSGLAARNTVRQNELNADAANLDVQTIKQQTVLNVTLAYLQVLSTEEQLQTVRTQAALSEKQLARLELQKKKGVVAVSQVSDLKGQLLNDQLTIVDLQNSLEWYKMELAQHMNIPYAKDMQLAKVDVEQWLIDDQQTGDEIYRKALLDLPQIRAAELRTQSAEYRLRAIKGQKYPQVFVGGNLQTVFTSSAQTADGKVGFSDQFWNNRFATISAGVRIPIFTGNLIRNNIRQAEIGKKNASLTEESEKTEVWRQIERAWVAWTNAKQRYKTLTSQLEAYKISYQAAEARFTTGVDNSLDYLLSKNNLDRAALNFSVAKYDLILKKRVLEYYYQNAVR